MGIGNYSSCGGKYVDVPNLKKIGFKIHRIEPVSAVCKGSLYAYIAVEIRCKKKILYDNQPRHQMTRSWCRTFPSRPQTLATAFSQLMEFSVSFEQNVPFFSALSFVTSKQHTSCPHSIHFDRPPWGLFSWHSGVHGACLAWRRSFKF